MAWSFVVLIDNAADEFIEPSVNTVVEPMVRSSDTDTWVGKEIGLWVDKNIQFGTKIVSGLRVKVFQNEPDFSDVNAGAQSEAYAQEQQNTASSLDQQPEVSPDPNDDIPW